DVLDFGVSAGPAVAAANRTVVLTRLVVADPVDVRDAGAAAVPADLARIRDLAAALCVEGALLELDERVSVVRAHGEQAGIGAELLVTNEARGRCLGGEAQDRPVMILGAVCGRRPHPGASALLLHQLLEA